MIRHHGGKFLYAATLVAALWLNSTFAQGFAPAVEQWRGAASEACGGDASCANYVLSVIACESGGDPNAVGAYGELGILQVDPAYWGVMGPVEQIYFFLNPPAGAWWVCG